jgi:urease accessory protein UreF
MLPHLPIEVTCPKCGTKYVAQVNSVVDVGQEPTLKAALLRGRLNTVRCPSCGAVGAISTPLLYHDPDRELLLLLFPPQLNLKLEDRERLTGSLVNALMSTLPADARKGYFFNPRTVLTMQSLIEEVLKADGLTDEMIERQRNRGRVLQDLLRALDQPEQLQSLIEENREYIDYSFFLTLSAAAEDSTASGQEELGERLLTLRDTLLEKLAITLPEPLSLETPRAEVLDQILQIDDEASRRAFVLYNRPLLDYAFFQELTARIDQASLEQVDSLRSLRTKLLELTQELDKETLAMRQARIRLLQEILENPDPVQALRERKREIDGLFLGVLAAAIRAAEESQSDEELQQLQSLSEAAMSMLQEDLPPELRLVNDLLAAEYAEGTEQVLRQRRDEWSADFVDMLAELVKDLEAQGRNEAAQRLSDVRQQALELLQEVDDGPQDA